MATHASQLSGRVLAGRYTLGARRGVGRNGAVYDAVDGETGRSVAVRLLNPELGRAEVFRARFAADMAAAVEVRHPNLVRVETWGAVDIDGDEVAYIVNELLTGGSLRDLVDRGRLLSPAQALLVGLDACRGLDAAHRAGVVHGELNSSSVVFGADRRLRIVDLGLSTALAAQEWSHPASVGLETARYAAPEQAQGRPYGPKADVYALALCLIEAVTGRVPFSAESTVATLNARIDKLMPVSADLGPLAAVLERAGRPDPDERYSAADFGRALVQAAEKLDRPAPLPLLTTGLFSEVATPRQPAPRSADPTGPIAAPVEPPPPPPSAVAAATPPLAPPAAAPAAAAPAAPPSAVSPGAPSAASPAAPLPPPVGQVPSPGMGLDPHPSGAVPVTAGAARPAHDLPTEPVERTATAPAVGAAAGAPVAAAPPVEIFDQDQPRRRWWLWALVAIIVVAALAAAGVVAYGRLSTETHAVPDLVGMELGEAQNEIAGFDWEVEIVRERSDDFELDHVIRTEPAVGVEVDEGDPFTMVVSDGPTLPPLPEINGLTLEEATERLENAKLAIEVASEEFSEDVPPGVVISWSVPEQPGATTGMEVVQGTVVAVVVSAGPEPRVVPNLAGMSPADARAALEGLKLVYAEGEQVFSDTVPAGQVAQQAPAPDSQVARGDTVTVQLSKGPDLVVFPEIGATDEASLRATLEAAGFQVGTISGDPTQPLQSLLIAGQPVYSGQSYPRSAAVVDIIYAPTPTTTAPPEEPPA